MKSNLILVSLAIVFTSVNCLVSKEVKDGIKKLISSAASCNSGAIAPEKVVAIIEHRAWPETREESCDTACTLKLVGLMNDKKINLKVVEEINKMKYSTQPEVLTKFMPLAKKCAEEAEKLKDECDIGKELLKCFHDKSVEENIPFATLSR